MYLEKPKRLIIWNGRSISHKEHPSPSHIKCRKESILQNYLQWKEETSPATGH